MTEDVEQAIAELLDRMGREEADLNDVGLCALPGCGKRITGKRRQRYCDTRHRDRRYKARVQAVAELRGVRAHHSLKTLRASDPSPDRRHDAQTARNGAQRPRRPRPGVTVYLPTLDVAGDVLLELEQAGDAQGDVERARAAGYPAHTAHVVTAIEAIAAALERRRRRDLPAQTPTTPGGP